MCNVTLSGLNLIWGKITFFISHGKIPKIIGQQATFKPLRFTNKSNKILSVQCVKEKSAMMLSTNLKLN